MGRRQALGPNHLVKPVSMYSAFTIIWHRIGDLSHRRRQSDMQIIKMQGKTCPVFTQASPTPFSSRPGPDCIIMASLLLVVYFSLFLQDSKGSQTTNNRATCNGFPSTLLPKPSNQWLFKEPPGNQKQSPLSTLTTIKPRPESLFKLPPDKHIFR